jgi:hypothetical protein
VIRLAENHPLASLMETLGTLVETYESSHLPEPPGDPLASLREFMADHDLTAKDLPKPSDETAVAEILAGARDLIRRQNRNRMISVVGGWRWEIRDGRLVNGLIAMCAAGYSTIAASSSALKRSSSSS